jgi:hypothetical protein
MTTVSADPRTSSQPLPQALRRGLARIEIRLRAIGVLKGLGTLGLVMALGATLGMAADVAFALPSFIRWAIWLTWVAALGLIVARALFPYLGRPFRWVDLAAIAESGNPELGERLTSTVDLLTDDRHAHGSPALIAALVEQTVDRAEGLDLARSLSYRRAAIRMALGCALIILLIAPSIARPEPFQQILKRFIMPWSGVDRVGRFIIDVRPGDLVTALGSDAPLSATVRSWFGSHEAPVEAWLEWDDAHGVKHRTRMTADSDEPAPRRSFEILMPRVTSSFAYRVRSGGALSRRHSVTAVEPPAITHLTVSIAPPAYTRLPAMSYKDPLRIDAWEGSRITLSVATNGPLEKVEVEWPVESRENTPSHPRKTVSLAAPSKGNSEWTTTLPADSSGPFEFHLRDGQGLRNAPEPTRRIMVIRDAPPTASFLDDKLLTESRPDDMLSTEVEARDDRSVVQLEWHYAIQRTQSVASPEEGRVAVKLPGLGTRRARGEASLDLKSLNLKQGDVLSYRMRVIDNKPEPAGPNVGWSEVRTLSIIDKADPMLARKAAAERSDIQQRLETLRKLAADNRQGAEQLRYAADAVARGNGAWDASRDQSLKEREASAREVIDRLETLARAVDDHPQFSPLARPARQVARVEAEGGREMLDQARKAADASRRLADLRQADGRLAAVQTRLDELQRLFDDLARLDEDRRKLQTLAQRQENLAQKAAELADDPANRGGDRARLDQIRNEQERLSRELNELTRQSPSLRAEVLAVQAKAAEKLAEQARALAERQRAEARKTAGLNRDDPRLRALLEAQRALEDDARRLAMRVDLPLEENGRARLNAEVLRRAEEPIERGDVAQAKQSLEQSEDELRRLARDLEDVRDDPKALARRLARRQEQLRDAVRETVRENIQDRDKPSAAELRRLRETMKPLSAREAVIAQLAGAIPTPDNQRPAAMNAERAARRALENLHKPGLPQTEERQNQAVEALQRLANELPDLNQRRDQTRQKLAQARAKAQEVAQELERHLRETAPQPGRTHDNNGAAAELAKRFAPLARRQEEVAEALAELEIEPRAQPQQDRAARRAQRLADALDDIREQAPRDAKIELDVQAPTDWRVIGPFRFDAAPPMPVGGPIDLKAIHEGVDAKATWKPISSQGGQGLVNLGEIYNRKDNQAAFGIAELSSPSQGKAQLVVGSDDTLMVWLNGRQVYQFDGNRQHAFGQDKADVDVVEGVNRFVVKCGNRNGEWMYSLGMRLPNSTRLDHKPDLRLVQSLRAELPAIQLEARAALDRLEQKLHGREPADDLAEQLAAEANDLSATIDRGPADDPAVIRDRDENQRRLATALRALNVPDAALLQGEAVRSAERAVKMIGGDKAEPRRVATAEAARAVENLARRLADALPASERAAALARAQRAVDAPEGPRDFAALAKAQRAIADEAAPLSLAGHEAAAKLTDQAARMAERAVRGDQGDPTDVVATPQAMKVVRVEAAAALEAMARGATPPHEAVVPANQAKGAEPKSSPRARAESLATRQREIAQKIQATGKKTTAAEVAKLVAEQSAIAEAARELANPHPATAAARREGEHLRAQTTKAAESSAGALARQDPAGALAEARKAAAALQRMAEALPDRPAEARRAPAAVPRDADLTLNERHAAEARELARRERHIRERLQAVLGERIAPQERLREDAGALGRELADLRDQTRELSPRSHGPAHAAADMLQNHAPQTMNQATESMAQGRVPDAREAQRRSAEVLERAAQQAEDVATALRADRPADAGEPRGDLASARDAQRAASQQLAQAREPRLGAQAAQAASGSMQKAADGLRAAAQPRRGGQPGKEPGEGEGERTAQQTPGQGKPGANAAEPHSAPGGTAAADLAELQAMVRSQTGRKWGELPGHLRSEILQMSKGRYRDDYARLIRLYFREIAADAPAQGKQP